MINKPIEMLVTVDTKGNMKPIRFRVEENGEYQVIKVIGYKLDTLRKGFLRYTCRVQINDAIHIADISYEIDTMKWKLEKL